MGFRLEGINLELEKTNMGVSRDFKLNMLSDTINPSTPKKVVEETVSSEVSVRQTQVEVERENVLQEPSRTTAGEAQENKITETKERTEEQNIVTRQESAVDTVRHAGAAPKRTNIESTATSTLLSTDNIIDSIPIYTQPRVAESLDNSRTAILRDEYVLDSIARIDSLNLVEAVAKRKLVSNYSYVTHKEGIGLPVKLDRSDGIFILLLVCFLLLAHVYNGGMSFIKDNIMLVFSASKSQKLETQSTTKELFYSYFLVFLAVLLISISLYEGLDRFMPLEGEERRPFITIGLFIILISIFLSLKMILNRLIGYIFDFGKRITTWNQSYLVLLSMLGLLCFLPTLLLVYSNLWHSIIIGFVLVLFLIVQIILFFRIIIFFIEQKFNFLYLIAYLCTVEILPYIFLGIGLVYLYRIDIFNTIL